MPGPNQHLGAIDRAIASLQRQLDRHARRPLPNLNDVRVVQVIADGQGVVGESVLAGAVALYQYTQQAVGVVAATVNDEIRIYREYGDFGGTFEGAGLTISYIADLDGSVIPGFRPSFTREYSGAPTTALVLDTPAATAYFDVGTANPNVGIKVLQTGWYRVYAHVDWAT